MGHPSEPVKRGGRAFGIRLIDGQPEGWDYEEEGYSLTNLYPLSFMHLTIKLWSGNAYMGSASIVGLGAMDCGGLTGNSLESTREERLLTLGKPLGGTELKLVDEQGDAVAYALWKLEDRGRMIVTPGEKLYEGMIIGIHSRDNDLIVNPIKGKQLTNVRSSGTDEAVRLTPPIRLTLESAVEFIDDDELVEITPLSVRVRKRFLTENERKRQVRGV